MHHLTAGIFGDREILKKLGKQGTINDITIYNHASSEGVYTYLSPSSERVHALLEVACSIDIPVLVIDELTREVAEQLVAVDAMNFDNGFIISSNEQLSGLIKGSSLEKFVHVADEKELREKLSNFQTKQIADGPWAPIDNYFNVKSVGTVILSLMKGGAIKKHDKLLVAPLGKEVIIKGIQSQDRDIDSAEIGMRIGLNLKGVEADELKRGYVICKDATVSKTLKIEFTKSRYSKEVLEVGSQVFVGVGMQVVPARIDDANNLTVTLEHPIAHLPNQKCLIATTKQALPRIIGSGKIL